MLPRHRRSVCLKVDPPTGPVTGGFDITTDCGSVISTVMIGTQQCEDLRDATTDYVKCRVPRGIVGRLDLQVLSGKKVTCVCPATPRAHHQCARANILTFKNLSRVSSST